MDQETGKPSLSLEAEEQDGEVYSLAAKFGHEQEQKKKKGRERGFRWKIKPRFSQVKSMLMQELMLQTD